jgi:uncharacterized protein YbaR (Trm112 family)
MNSSDLEQKALQPAIQQLLACPTCRGALDLEPVKKHLRCISCQHRYPIIDGIPVLLPNGGSRGQEDERIFRDNLAAENMNCNRGALLDIITRHHCTRVMSRKAREFRKRFAATDWILDIGIGYGWHWTAQDVGGQIVGIDFSFGNLKLARHILGNTGNVLLVLADAACLPLQEHVVAGVWSVQVFQHFPSFVFSQVLTELDRVMQNQFHMEIYNLNPALLLKVIYTVFGKRLHTQGRAGLMELERFAPYKWKELWHSFRPGTARIQLDYSELFFHPDLHFRPRVYPLFLERCVAKYAPRVAALIARQGQIYIDNAGAEA